MRAEEFEKMYRAEKEFFWFAAKGELLRRWAERWFSEEGWGLDLGCGTGANLERLSRFGHFAGVDKSREAIEFCRRRGHGFLVLADSRNLPFKGESFIKACALDLFEHLEDDLLAAKELFRVLQPGARLIVTVPAHPWLWSSHDLALGHKRRYRRRELVELLQEAGFRIVRATHFFCLLFPLLIWGKFLQKVWGDPDETISYDWPGMVNRILLAVERMELGLLRFVNMPFGTTVAAVVEKPG